MWQSGSRLCFWLHSDAITGGSTTGEIATGPGGGNGEPATVDGPFDNARTVRVALSMDLSPAADFRHLRGPATGSIRTAAGLPDAPLHPSESPLAGPHP